MTKTADLGLIGLGVMGRGLALNFADHGFRVALYDSAADVAAETAALDPKLSAYPALPGLIAALRPPAVLLMMIPAGAAVDQQIAALASLEPGSTLIDGGNSHYRDTLRRSRQLSESGVYFLGLGVSGGEAGARHGPSLMAGGDPIGFERVAGLLEAIAADVGGEPCCAYFGSGGAGHFVKMVHNGIEYADMQLIAEAYALLREQPGLSHDDMSALFAQWNEGPLNSYLIEITAAILKARDPDSETPSAPPLVEAILDRAGQKGTGRWAAESALELGVAAPTLIEAVCARSLSALKEQRVAAQQRLPAKPLRPSTDLRAALPGALLVAKASVYAQGFALLQAANDHYRWSARLADAAKVWRGGCIIRAQFLDDIRTAYQADTRLANLLLDDYFVKLLTDHQQDLRIVVAAAAEAAIAVPALGSALAYFDGYRNARSAANLIQAQRDYFGAHRYERIDKPGQFHSDWARL